MKAEAQPRENTILKIAISVLLFSLFAYFILLYFLGRNLLHKAHVFHLLKYWSK